MHTRVIRDENDNGGFNSCSKDSTEFPLLVNCAGKINISHPFLTHNKVGRLDYYLLFITGGKLKVDINGETKLMGTGDFVIFPPKYKYRYEIGANSAISYLFVHFTGSHVTEYLDALKMTENPIVRHARFGEEIALAISSFFLDYESGSEIKDVALSVDFSRILLMLSKEAHNASRARLISKSLAFINENYMKEIRIPELAALEGLSVSRYNFLFKECVGTSPVKYMTNLRMRQARLLLDSTSLSVKQIGEMVGYEDNHFFSKLFKACVGTSPVSYRKSGREE